MKNAIKIFTALAVVFGFANQIIAKDIKASVKGNLSQAEQKQVAQLLETLEQEYQAQTNNYETDYKVLSAMFARKTYNEVVTDAKYFLGKSNDIISYDGKKYNRVALLHAALHNLISRKNTYPNGEEFTLDHKVYVMHTVYDIAKEVGLNQKDENTLFNFAKYIVANGKQYFDGKYINDFTLPGFSKDNNLDKQQRAEREKAKYSSQANGAARAIAVLPLVSKTNEQKAQAVQAIHKLLSAAERGLEQREWLLAFKVGSETLIAFKTEDSLSKLTTEYLPWWFRVISNFAIDLPSDRQLSRAGINLGLGKYYKHTTFYPDPLKNVSKGNDKDAESHYNTIYTDVMEDIGKALGKNITNAQVAKVVDNLVREYLEDVNKEKGKFQTSLIVGILATTSKKTANLNKAAEIIYNGSWYDINEITQRDKNNIAAVYLGKPKKSYNAAKYKEFEKYRKMENSLVISKDRFAALADKRGQILSKAPEVLTK